MTRPRCPYCNTQGLKHLAVQQVGVFNLVYCGQCGAIYGVIPSQKQNIPRQEKTGEPQPPPESEPPDPPPQETESSPDEEALYQKLPHFFDFVGDADLSKKVPYNPQRILNVLKSTGQIHNTNYRKYAELANEPPLCPDHSFEMIKATIPEGYKNAGVEIWFCPHGNCEHFHLAD